MPDLDLILPCYNPLGNWEEEILESLKAIDQLSPGIQINIILVNDGSSPTLSPEKIERLTNQIAHFTFIDSQPNKGKGHALRVGIQQSQHQICMFTDIDFPYTAESFYSLYKALLEENCEVAVGIRDNSYYAQTPFSRKLVSKLFKTLLKTFFRLKIADTQCGLKGFKQTGKSLFLQTTINRYLFDLEFIKLASRKVPKQIRGIPVELKEGVVFSKLNTRILLQEGWSFLRIFFKV